MIDSSGEKHLKDALNRTLRKRDFVIIQNTKEIICLEKTQTQHIQNEIKNRNNEKFKENNGIFGSTFDKRCSILKFLDLILLIQ